MRSSTEVTNELADAFRQAGEEFASHSAVFRVVVEGPPKNLHPIVRDEVYRIGREAIRNAFRHGEPKTVEVKITYCAELRLRVRDDGKGIDAAILDHHRPGHYGIPGMRERARQMGAALRLHSTAGAGTEIELSVPGSRAFAIAFKHPLARLFARKREGKHSAAGPPNT
jgi:signal transduction histidine kinase